MYKLKRIFSKLLDLDDPITYQVFILNILFFLVVYMWFFLNSDRPAISYWIDAPLIVSLQIGGFFIWQNTANPSELRWLIKISGLAWFLILVTAICAIIAEIIRSK